MAVRSVLEVEVDPEGQFAKFAAEYKRWQDAAANMPSLLGGATAETDKQVKSFRELVDLAKERAIHSRANAEVEKAAHEDLYGEEERAAARLAKQKLDAENKLSEQTKRQEKSWSNMAKSVKSFASGIGTATVSLLQWGTLTGVVSGVIGAGGLFGIDRLAIGVGNQRRVGLGLGVSAGEQQAFGLNFGRVVESPEALLGGVNEALHDGRKSVPFATLGLNYKEEQRKGTFQASVDVLQAIKKLADRTPESAMGPTFDAYHVGDMGSSKQDFYALKHTSQAELDKYISQARSDAVGLNLTKDQQQAWQNLQVQLMRAGAEIENVFIVGLKPLAAPFEKLSGSVVHAINAFAHSDRVQTFIGQVGDGLESFARKIDRPDFLKSVSAMGDRFGEFAIRLKNDLPGIESFADAVAKAGKFLAGKDNTPWNKEDVPNTPAARDSHPTGFGQWLYNHFDRLREYDNWFSATIPKWLQDHGMQSVPPAGASPAEGSTPISYWGSRPTWGNGGGFMPATFTTLSGGSASNSGGATAFGSGFTSSSFIVPKSLGSSASEGFAHGFFRAQGWTEAQTAGLLANIRAESGFNPKAYNGEGGGEGAQGIAQWRGPRADDFARMFHHSLRQGTMLEQLMFMQYELTHGEKAAGDALKAVGNNSSLAGTVVNRDYERSADRTGKRETTADYYAHLYSKPPASITVHNATGGNAVVTASQLAA